MTFHAYCEILIQIDIQVDIQVSIQVDTGSVCNWSKL